MSVLKRMPPVGNPPLVGQVVRIRRQPGHYVDSQEAVVDVWVGTDLVTLLAPEAGKVLTCLDLYDRVKPGDPVFEITGAGMPTYELFIAYRQADSAGHAGRLGDHMVRDFGRGQVFKDVESLPLGKDFVGVIRDMLSRAAAMVVVVGPQWLTLHNADGPRIQQADDLHREEIRTALARQIPIFPALVNGARMPAAKELPEDIRAFATKYAVEIRDRNWEADIAPLSVAVAHALAESPRRRAFLDQVPTRDPRLRTGPAWQWVTDDPLGMAAFDGAAARAAAPTFTMEWGAHTNGITLRGRNTAPEILRAVRCTVVGVERWAPDIEQFVKDPQHYPADVFPPLLLTGQQDLGKDDTADFGFIHLAEHRLDLEGQQRRVSLRKPGTWRFACLIEHKGGSLGELALCLSWEGAGKHPVGLTDCPSRESIPGS